MENPGKLFAQLCRGFPWIGGGTSSLADRHPVRTGTIRPRIRGKDPQHWNPGICVSHPPPHTWERLVEPKVIATFVPSAPAYVGKT